MMEAHSQRATKHLRLERNEECVHLEKGREGENGVMKARGPQCSPQGVLERNFDVVLFQDACWLLLLLSANLRPRTLERCDGVGDGGWGAGKWLGIWGNRAGCFLSGVGCVRGMLSLPSTHMCTRMPQVTSQHTHTSAQHPPTTLHSRTHTTPLPALPKQCYFFDQGFF